MVFEDGRGNDGLQEGLVAKARRFARLISLLAAFCSAMCRAALGPLGTNPGMLGGCGGVGLGLAAATPPQAAITRTVTRTPTHAAALPVRGIRDRLIVIGCRNARTCDTAHHMVPSSPRTPHVLCHSLVAFWL